MHKIRDLVRAELERREWSVYRLAKESGAGQTPLHRWLNENSDLRISNLELVLDALGLEVRRKRETK
jgi:hypothetical protein